MNPALPSRAAKLRQSAAVVCYLVAAAILLVLTVTAISGIFDQRAALAASADLLAQLEGRRLPSSQPGAAAPAAIPAGSPFLEGQTLTVAGAALLQRVAEAVTKVGGNVLSSQVDVQGVQAKDGYVSVLASCEVDEAAMQRLLYDLEAGMPYLFIEQFVAQAPQTGQAAPEQANARMRLLLGVSGRWEGGK
ncbi:MAG: type II secretion system protein M [Alphaproteobacteria bacterium]|nr:type II secretion system protein M [Alphaproteobacteria bacterium]